MRPMENDPDDPVRVVSRVKNNRLLALYEQSGLTVDEFVARLGICKGTWYRLTSLKLYPTDRMAERLAEATGLGKDYLFPRYLKAISRTIAVHSVSEPEMLRLEAARNLSLPSAQEEAVEKRELRETMAAALDELPDREAGILRMVFGFYGEEATYDEIGDRYGISPSRVQQLAARGLRKLRNPIRLMAAGLHELM